MTNSTAGTIRSHKVAPRGRSTTGLRDVLVYKIQTPSPRLGPAPSLRTPFHSLFLTYIPYFMDHGLMNRGRADHGPRSIVKLAEKPKLVCVTCVEEQLLFYL